MSDRGNSPQGVPCKGGDNMDRMGMEIVDHTIEMILVFDESGEIKFSNQTVNQELGYEEGMEHLNMKDVMLKQFCGDGDEFSIEELLNASEAVLYRKNLSCFTAAIRVVPSKVKEGQYQLLATDNTQRQELQRQLVRVKEEAAEAMKARNEFVANVTHELRTPLNGMRGHLTTLRDTNLDAKQMRTTDIILQCCENMAAIINNILDFSKMEAGKFTIEKKEFNFRKMLNHVIDTSITAINEKGLYLIANVAEDIPENVVGDELRVIQVLNNLLSNAIKFTSVGYISIEITKALEFDKELELFFMVKDTGIGMTREEQDKIFKSFTQADASITRKYGGTGLGLTITKQLVELMGGSIHLDSEKGKGSTFSFRIRLELAEHQEQAVVEGKSMTESVPLFKQCNTSVNRFDSMENFFSFGTQENTQEIRNKMEKLIICLELEAWDRAESFASNLKSLLRDREDLKKLVFRLEMCLRKEDYDKSMKRYQDLKAGLEAEIGGI